MGGTRKESVGLRSNKIDIYRQLKDDSFAIEVDVLKFAYCTASNFDLFLEILNIEHFSHESTKAIASLLFSNAKRLELSDLKINLSELDYKVAEKIRITSTLVEFENCLETYTKLIEFSKRIKLSVLTNNLSKDIENYALPIEMLTEFISERIIDIADDSQSEIVEIGEIVENAKKDFSEENAFIPTGIRSLDNIINGLRKKRFIIIAARPSVGKTALALTMLKHIGFDMNEPCLFYSDEMPSSELLGRLISQVTEIDNRYIENCVANNDNRVKDFYNAYLQKKIFIDDKNGYDLASIKRTLRKYVRRHNIKVCFIDYLQLIKSGEKPIREQMIDVSGAMKKLAKEYNIPIVGLAQFSRAAASERRRNLPSDLKESGSLEQDADVIISIERPFADGKDSFFDDTPDPSGNLAYLHVDKNRGGKRGKALVEYIGKFTQFKDYENAEF